VVDDWPGTTFPAGFVAVVTWVFVGPGVFTHSVLVEIAKLGPVTAGRGSVADDEQADTSASATTDAERRFCMTPPAVTGVWPVRCGPGHATPPGGHALRSTPGDGMPSGSREGTARARRFERLRRAPISLGIL
jgi:hypothetical protein